MKNIAIIISKLNGGGAEKVAANLSIDLSKYFNVHLIVFDGSNKTYNHAGFLHDLKITHSNNPIKKILNVFKRISETKKIKKENNIEISISLLDGPNIVNTASKVKDKTIISIRNHITSENNSKIRMFFLKYAFNKSDYTVAISEHVKSDILEHKMVKDSSKVGVIYNSVNKDLIESKAEKETNLTFEKENFYVLNMGRLVNQKGQWHLIRSMVPLFNKYPNIRLIILGTGPLEEQLKNLAVDLKIEDKVIFTGYIENPYPYVKNSNLFVFSSLFEGLGNSLLEAMSLNKAIISTDCLAGPRELFSLNKDYITKLIKYSEEEFAILVPKLSGEFIQGKEELEESEIELSKAIEKMYLNSDMRLHYEAKSKLRSNDFSPEIISQEWLKVIENILKGDNKK